MSLEDAIMGEIVFRGKKEGSKKDEDKVKTKAKETTYIKGTHDSRAAKTKAEIRRERVNRHKR